MKSNMELVTDIRAAHTEEIAVIADAGVVTLRGTVGSLHQRRVAEVAAKRVAGVTEVHNALDVRLMDEWAREDAAVRGAALQALAWNTSVPSADIDVKVRDGHLVLKGTVDWQYQKAAAESAVSMLAGVVGVSNEIEVTTPATEVDGISTQIENAFARNAQVNANAIRISAQDGHVTLRGDVGSWAEHDAAMAAAFAAPGVRDVDDLLTVTG
jgi:osmotically-inducible protein OsmY